MRKRMLGEGVTLDCEIWPGLSADTMLSEPSKYWVKECSGRVKTSCGGLEVATRQWNDKREGRVDCEGILVSKGQVTWCFKGHGKEFGSCS